MDANKVKKAKTNIDIMQVAATDKENLTQKIGPKKKLATNNGRTKLGKKDINVSNPNNKSTVEIKNKINKCKTDVKLKTKSSEIIVASDLTSDVPNEKYWEKLAESRRVALESALKENFDLNSKLSEMEYENFRLKEMLSEAQTLVEVLTEMLEGNKDGKLETDLVPGDVEADSVEEGSQAGDASENESFQSCI